MLFLVPIKLKPQMLLNMTKVDYKTVDDDQEGAAAASRYGHGQ